jgi:hypothetical protein
MAQRYTELNEKLRSFILNQNMFFVATATSEGTINLSPKGLDTFRILSPNRVAWLNLTGSGNETATHLHTLNRITLMFCAFQDDPMILRLYGHAKVLQPKHSHWKDLLHLFPQLPGARQIIDINLSLVQTSCGMAVPMYQFLGHRNQLNLWANKMGEKGIRHYWETKNRISVDGNTTGILE